MSAHEQCLKMFNFVLKKYWSYEAVGTQNIVLVILSICWLSSVFQLFTQYLFWCILIFFNVLIFYLD